MAFLQRSTARRSYSPRGALPATLRSISRLVTAPALFYRGRRALQTRPGPILQLTDQASLSPRFFQPRPLASISASLHNELKVKTGGSDFPSRQSVICLAP